MQSGEVRTEKPSAAMLRAGATTPPPRSTSDLRLALAWSDCKNGGRGEEGGLDDDDDDSVEAADAADGRAAGRDDCSWPPAGRPIPPLRLRFPGPETARVLLQAPLDVWRTWTGPVVGDSRLQLRRVVQLVDLASAPRQRVRTAYIVRTASSGKSCPASPFALCLPGVCTSVITGGLLPS